MNASRISAKVLDAKPMEIVQTLVQMLRRPYTHRLRLKLTLAKRAAWQFVVPHE
jgi:hypothetical protein